MEAIASLSSTMASTHFSHSLPLSKISFWSTKPPRTCCSSSSWTGSTNALSFSSRNSFTEVWRVINSRIVMKQEVAEDLQKKIMSAKFDFDDFLEQTRAIARLATVTRAHWMIPGLGKITAAQIREAEDYLIVMERMINVMSPEEREKPELLLVSLTRRQRVVRDSGKTEQQVSQLVAQLFQMRERMKDFLDAVEGEINPELKNLEKALKAKKEMEKDQQRKAEQKENDQMKQEVSEELLKKIMSGTFDFDDFLEQTRAVARLDTVPRARWKIPGLGKITAAQIRDADTNLIVMERMIDVMLPEERKKPELLAESFTRRERVARVSERTEEHVSRLLALLFERRVRMKKFLEE